MRRTERAYELTAKGGRGPIEGEGIVRTHETEHKSFAKLDETCEFPRGRAEILKVGGAEVGRLVFQPGWRCSNDVKPIAETASCKAPHFQHYVSGRLAILLDDGRGVMPVPATSARFRAVMMSGWSEMSRRW